MTCCCKQRQAFRAADSFEPHFRDLEAPGSAAAESKPIRYVNRDDVGALYALSRVHSVLFNTTDPRFWLKRAAIVVLQFALVIASLALWWDEEIPRCLFLISLAGLLLEPVLVYRAYTAVRASHAELETAFKACDLDRDGVLNPQEAAEFLKDFSQFRLRCTRLRFARGADHAERADNKNQFYTINDVKRLLRHRKRSYFRPLLELLISFSSFYATLMIHDNGHVDAVSLVLGYLGIVDIIHVLHRLFVVCASSSRRVRVRVGLTRARTLGRQTRPIFEPPILERCAAAGTASSRL